MCVVASTLEKCIISSDLDECNVAGAVRLVNGSHPKEGSVEVCYDGQYRVVCDSYWDELDATVVCAQLGYTQGGIYIYLLWLGRKQSLQSNCI